MKKNLTLLGRLYKIQLFNYLNDGAAISMGLVMIVIVTVCWMGLKPKAHDGNFLADPFVLASALGMSSIRNSQFNFSNLLSDWRLKGTFRTLGQLSISKALIGFGLITFCWILSFVIMFIIFGVGMIFPQQRQIIAYTNWPIFLSGLFLDTVLMSLLATAPQFWIKSASFKTTICLISYFVPMYLLGLGIPLNITGNVVWLNYLTYILPHRYTLAVIQSGFIWKAVPNLNLPIEGMKFPDLPGVPIPGGVKPGSFLAQRGFGFNQNLWMLYLLIFAWMLIFSLIIYLGYRRLYRFNLRKYKVYEGSNQHLHYVHQIQRTGSLTELNLVIKQINSEMQKKSVSALPQKAKKQKRRVR